MFTCYMTAIKTSNQGPDYINICLSFISGFSGQHFQHLKCAMGELNGYLDTNYVQDESKILTNKTKCKVGRTLEWQCFELTYFLYSMI